MFRHPDRFGEQRARHRRSLNSWYWLGWWVQPVLESARDLPLAHASHWLDDRHVPELDRAFAEFPPADTDPQVRFLHACRAYLLRTGTGWSGTPNRCSTTPALGIEAGLFGGMARVRLEMCSQAEPILAGALMRCRSEQPQRKELRYWLARAHEGTGRTAAALPLYRAVHQVDAEFMDTAARIAAITEAEDGLDGDPDFAGLPYREPGSADPAQVYQGGRELGIDPADVLGPDPAGAPVRPPPTRPAPGRPPCLLPAALSPRAFAARLPLGSADPVMLDQALAELERMVGLDPVKRQVKALSAQLRIARLRAGQGLPVQPPKRHFVFSGPSGTGKTTVARILGRVFYALGLLGGDHLIEAQRADLVGEFLGQTAVKANELIDSALGGVLFVDEAYALSNSGYGKGDAYGDEALQVLLEAGRGQPRPAGGDPGRLPGGDGPAAGRQSRAVLPVHHPGRLPPLPPAGADPDRRGAGRRERRRWDDEALDELRAIAGTSSTERWIDELGNGRFLRTLYEKCCAYRDLRLSGYTGTPGREDLSTLRLPGPDAGVRRGAGRPRPRAAVGVTAPGRRRLSWPSRTTAARRAAPPRRCAQAGPGVRCAGSRTLPRPPAVPARPPAPPGPARGRPDRRPRPGGRRPGAWR